MKNTYLICFFILLCPVFLTAFEVKGKSQSNFGTQHSTEKNDSKSTESSTSTTRSFTSYGARQNWGQGVQTQTVKTNKAGDAVSQFQSTEVQTNKISTKVTTTTSTADTAAKPVTTQASSQTVAGVGDMAQAAAAMQQLQGMQNMVQNMGTLMGGAPSGNNAAKGPNTAGAPSAQGNGMPDISAILNSVGAPATGKK